MHVQERRLDQLGTGEQAVIAYLSDGDADILRRLREMGLAEGTQVEVLHRAPLGGDPIAVRADDIVIAMRRAQARMVVLAPAATRHALPPTGLAEAAE